MSLSINDIPSHWKLKRLKNIANFSNGKGHEKGIDEDGEFIVVNSKFISTDTKVKKFSKQNLCPLKKNDITIVMSDIPNGKAIAKCFIVDEDNRYTLNQRIGSITVKDGVDTKFLYYVLNRNRYYLAFDNGVGQTNLKKDEVINCPIQLPPLPEQQKIADILSIVDAKIEVIDQQITETQELKKGLMQRLLTKGIGHTQFKDSALGLIPMDWEVVKIQDIADVNKESLPNSTPEDYELFYIDLSSVKNGVIDCPIEKIKFSEAPSRARRKIKTNDVIMATVRPNLLGYGYIDFETCDYYVSTGFAVISHKSNSNGRFLYQYLYSEIMQSQIEKLIVGSNYPAINSSDVKMMKIPNPPIEEQQKIAEILTSVDDKIEVLSEKKTTYQELKKGLMQQLLTGKVRVRV